MSHALPLLAVLSLSAAAAASLRGATQDAKGDFPSLASRVLTEYEPEPDGGEGAKGRVAAAEALIAALPEARRAELLLPLDDPERARWTNVPPRADEEGLRLGDCDEAGLRAACDLLATVLSPEGYERARDIVLADDRLLRNGRPRVGFGAENFWLVLFGTPSKDGAWGLQLDGHHIALNLSFHGERMTMSPTFLGAQPAKFKRKGDTVEPLASPVSAAFALIGSLDDEQRSAAIVAERRGSNVAAAGKDGFVPGREGLDCSGLTEAQTELALGLAENVLSMLPTGVATSRLEQLGAETGDMHFSWSGPTAPGSDVSFRLQGPTLLLEFACQDLGGDPLQHLHLMIRNPVNEYGAAFGQAAGGK